MKTYVMEFIGTFFLMLTIGASVISPSIGLFAPLAIGTILIALIYAGGPISGAHYNPAVTLGVYLSKKCPLKEVPYYLFAQLLGAVLAAYAVLFMKGAGNSASISLVPAFIAELLFTFALVFVILNVAFSKRTSGNHYFGLAIGMTVLAGTYAVGNVSGAVFNPAIAVGLIVMGLSELTTIGVYLGSQLLGGVLAWQAFRIMEADS